MTSPTFKFLPEKDIIIILEFIQSDIKPVEDDKTNTEPNQDNKKKSTELFIKEKILEKLEKLKKHDILESEGFNSIIRYHLDLYHFVKRDFKDCTNNYFCKFYKSFRFEFMDLLTEMGSKQETDNQDIKSKLIGYNDITNFIQNDNPRSYSAESAELDKLKISTLKDMVETKDIS